MKLFQRTQHSLFGEILDWMLTPLLLLWPCSLAVTWLVAHNLANKPFDRALQSNARALAQFIQLGPGEQVRFSLPQPASVLLRAGDADEVFFQVLGARGEHLSGERALPAPPPTDADDAAVATTAPLLRDDDFRGRPVRVAYLWVPLGAGTGQQALVQVAETRDKRGVLANEIIQGVLLPQLAFLPLAVLLVWLALVRGIKPLSQLEQRIRARRPDDLSPIDDSAVPQEVAPLVDSVNDLLTRLKESVAAQKRFLADAAHQLKTPLAGLRMQADLAQRSGASATDLKHSLQQIGLSSKRATHTVNQLLALARAEGGSTALAREPLDLAALTMEVVRQAVPGAMERRVDLGYDGPEPGAPRLMRMGNAVLLKEMLRNLIENALHYTQSSASAGGHALPAEVTVRLRTAPPGGGIAIEVEDNGPGIAEGERELVFEPFYRVLGTNVDGTGLGLPIVREIAKQHGASVSIEAGTPHAERPGARFVVRFV